MSVAANIPGCREFNVDHVRADFPILGSMIHGRPLVYLDNAATTQKPRSVIDALVNYYETSNANIHRAVHQLSERATAMHDAARETIRRFINARHVEEIIFTRGTTEAINLVAATYGISASSSNNSIIITAMEHHSNIVPWQLLAERTGATLKVIPIDKDGVLDLHAAAALLAEGGKILSIVHISNALGTVNPINQLIQMAHQHNIPVLVDGAQSVQHMKINVQELDADFFAFSGHKIYGPTGIGVLYGRREILNQMPPFNGGGDMIRTVTFEKSTWNDLPYKFEAGTPDIAGAIGLAAALDYLSQFDMEAIAAHEHDLLTYATNGLNALGKIRIIGNAPEKSGAVSFVVDGVHPHDLGTFLDHDGIAIRTGHHCAQPVMDYFNIPATARASFGLYNTREEVEVFCQSLERTIKILS